MKPYLLATIGASLFAVSLGTQAANVPEVLQSKCASCHALTQPESTSLDRLWERKGPDLYYAGSKFNKDWLVKWLQNPVKIRPAGEFYRKHVKPGTKEDVVDESSLTAHPELITAEAEAAANALMTLTGPADLVEKGAFKNQKVTTAMGAMYFNKLRGCSACHTTAPGKGGLSGPEIATAGERLQPDFIYSYIKDPQKIDKGIWMPKLDISDADLQKLTSYIVQLSAKEDKK
ncbi:MAG: cytochrome c [Nitrosomonas sp.]|uniref:c-type cytochrome n=1 Tax=Nitrosomonas sp. TaxID=42353 RepID=UPI00255D1C84|nr:cytochrome c [Nitrosomonas sp.]MBE7526811.1 cytochrome c [Burkholderiales bacterium]MCC6161471.1 cytochrome c [Nitrosomonas sp.]MDL1866011.1 cytochrome c [Betaproteobacteria bacterium PRO4]